jgi:hypothetical protein
MRQLLHPCARHTCRTQRCGKFLQLINVCDCAVNVQLDDMTRSAYALMNALNVRISVDQAHHVGTF